VPPTVTPIPNTPTPSVREGDIVQAGPGVTAPVLLHRVDPEYPPIAQRAGLSGEVVAQLLVGINGRVEDVRIVEVSKTGVGFEKAAEDAVIQWRYRPATKHGVKVRVWVQITINLSLN
jgi:TonB family protein